MSDLPYLDLIHRIRMNSTGDIGYWAYLWREGPREGSFTESAKTPDHQPHGADVFFTPLLFNGSRSNKTVGGAGVLFADLDRAPYPKLRPSVYWNTSRGNTQAVWFLDTPIDDYPTWARLNQAMTRATEADQGGWHGSKLLRVPGTVNWKRRDFAGPVQYNPGVRYTQEEIEDFVYPIFPSAAEAEDKHYAPSMMNTDYPQPLLGPKDRNWLLLTYWPDLSLLAQSMLSKERVPDRSLHIIKTARELKKTPRVSPEVAFKMIWVAPWCKWRTDRHDPHQLWREVLAVYDS